MYNKSYQWYYMWLGKITTQELHFWERYPSSGHVKWEYNKDLNAHWFDFYNTIHNSTSNGEKIVSWYRYWFNSASNHQLWA